MANKIKHPSDKIDAVRNPDGFFVNTECFREEARHFQKYGRYCDAPPGTASHREYWEEQLRRRKEGYSVGGVRITGPHYEYLNFSPIKRTEEGVNVAKGAAKVRDFPDFWDYDYNYFHCLKIAREGITPEGLKALQLMVTPKSLTGNHHFIVGKTRRRGFSYKGATIAHNTYDTVRASLTILAAFEKKYMIPKGILAMFNNLISFIDANTAFAKRREFSNTAMHKKASYKEIINGTAVEKGFLSEVMGLTFKDNPDASRGGDAAVVLMDEAGEWPGLEQAFKVLQPLCEDGIYTTGQIIVQGTGGDMQGGSVDFAKMFYDPEAYNMLAFENIWDDDGDGDYCGFYTPDYMNKVGFIDAAGNSITSKAKDFEEARRAQMLASGKKEAYNQHIQEFSFMPSESFLITGDNMFPLKLLRRAKARLEASGRWKGIPVFLVEDKDGKVHYRPDLDGKLTPLYRYAGTPKDLTGAVVIYSPPQPGMSYRETYDTIQHEQGDSLASIQVYIDKPSSPLHNKLVCSFYGRGTGPDDCDMKALLMSRLYNDAMCMHENMYRSTKNNFIKWGFEHLLDSQPSLFIKNVIKDSKVEREYGVHMTDKIKLEGCLAANRLLETVVAPGEDGTEPLLYLDTIEDIRLIEELIRFNFTGNFDAAIGFLLRAIQDEEDTLMKRSSNPNIKGIGTQLEELRNARKVKIYR